jgi:DNA-binding transcriptional ArsR family regulator
MLGTHKAGTHKTATHKAPPRKALTLAAMQRQSALVFAALGDETRLRLIAALCAGSAMSIAQLTAGTDITRQSVTQHLEVLASAGLVRDVKVGRERLWQFEAEQLDTARRSLELIAQQWDKALARLKLAVED